jgi:structure-specific recognition protein 1
MNDNREKIKTDNPDIKFTEIAKVAGAQWKELSAEDKQPYEAKAAADKERYAAEMKAYKQQAGGGGGGDQSESEDSEDLLGTAPEGAGAANSSDEE